jgi:RNA polymerase sigma factor (sigma-70 family)
MRDEALRALAARAVNGDGPALSELCRQLETPVFRLCLRMLGEVGDAEDAAQDVLVKVVTHLASFEGRSALMTWVHQIAVRHVLALKKSKAEERSLDEERFGALLEQGLAFGTTHPPPTPEDRTLITEVRLGCTQGMLLMLTRDERLALVLVELLGFDAAEAADIADVSHDSMRQRLSRARSKLGNFLQAKCGVVNADAACHCLKQVPGRRALGLTLGTQRLATLASGDLALREELSVAAAELRSVRAIGAAFGPRGALDAPATLRGRIERVLPTLLGA